VVWQHTVKCIVMCMLCAVQDETELCSGVAAYCVKCIVMYMLCAVQNEYIYIYMKPTLCFVVA
jgi:hypothetical protein